MPPPQQVIPIPNSAKLANSMFILQIALNEIAQIDPDVYITKAYEDLYYASTLAENS